MSGSNRGDDAEYTPLSDSIRRILLRPLWIIAVAVIGVVLIVLLLVFLLTGTIGSSDDNNNNDSVLDINAIDYSKALIVADDYDLYVLDLTKENKITRQLLRTSRGIAAFDFYDKKTLYWTETLGREISSLSGKYKNLTQAWDWRPVAVALDFINGGKVYALDARGRKLDVYDPESGSFGIAVADLKRPVDVALDPKRGIMFIVQKDDSILKGNMDGTSLRRLIVSRSVSTVCLDRQSPRLYWAEDDDERKIGKIVSSNYEGGERRVVYCAPGVISLGVSGNRLFWAINVTNSNNNNNSSINNLWTCATGADGVCRPEDRLQLPFAYAKALKVYAGVAASSSIENPCADSNGGCQHLCLLKSSSSSSAAAPDRSCACFVGFRLSRDSKSCELAKEFLLYSRGDSIRGRLLLDNEDEQAFSDAIVPIPIRRNVVLQDKPVIDFDYNYYARTVAYSDDLSIFTANITGSSFVNNRSNQQHQQDAYDRRGCLKDLSYDWVTNDIYYVQDNCRKRENTSIGLLKPSEERYYAKSLQSFVPANGQLRSLVVDPNTGSYYFAIAEPNNSRARIYQARDLKKLLFSRDDWSVNETGLALDIREARLFWFSADLRNLHSASLNHPDVNNNNNNNNEEDQLRSVDISIITEPRSVAVYERHVYVANLTGVWRLDKLTGRGLVRLVPRFHGDRERNDDNELVSGVKIYAEALQTVNPDNPCAIANGRCRQFCLRVPRYVTTGPNEVKPTDQIKKICLCEDGSRISSADGLTCV